LVSKAKINFIKKISVKPLCALRFCGKEFFSTPRHGVHREYHGENKDWCPRPKLIFKKELCETSVVRKFFSTPRHGGQGE
jgi:hypothetical protein